MITFNTFPIIETKNLLLRRITHDDTYDIFELRKDPRMNSLIQGLMKAKKKQSHILIK